MYKKSELVYIKALTPIHAGAGQGLDIVDMPIQRERHSNIPKIEASSLKGAIKYELYNKLKIGKNKEEINKEDNIKELREVFGPESGDEHASAIGFTDARLLFFPIKSACDIYKLITCPYVLKRWMEDLSIVDAEFSNEISNKLKVEDGKFKAIAGEDERLVLEEYVFDKASNNDNLSKLEEILEAKIQGMDLNRVVMISDSDFVDLVTMYTEIITRNKIDVETGAAQGTGLFTEEYLPTETIMYFMVLGAPTFGAGQGRKAEEVINYFYDNIGQVFQVGGNATIGKGFVKMLQKEDIQNGGN